MSIKKQICLIELFRFIQSCLSSLLYTKREKDSKDLLELENKLNEMCKFLLEHLPDCSLSPEYSAHILHCNCGCKFSTDKCFER